MARLLKPLKVEEYNDSKLGFHLDIFYDRNKHDHFAKYGEEEVRAQDIHEIKAQVREKVQAWLAVTWTPVIEVRSTGAVVPQHRSRASHYGHLDFRYQRYWLGFLADGTVRKLDWHWKGDDEQSFDVPPPEGLRQAKHFFFWGSGNKTNIGIPYRAKGSSTSYDSGYHTDDTYHDYLPYSPELWLGLEALGEQIIAVRGAIAALLGHENAVALLEHVGAERKLLLPPHVSHHDTVPEQATFVVALLPSGKGRDDAAEG